MKKWTMLRLAIGLVLFTGWVISLVLANLAINYTATTHEVVTVGGNVTYLSEGILDKPLNSIGELRVIDTTPWNQSVYSWPSGLWGNASLGFRGTLARFDRTLILPAPNLVFQRLGGSKETTMLWTVGLTSHSEVPGALLECWIDLSNSTGTFYYQQYSDPWGWYTGNGVGGSVAFIWFTNPQDEKPINITIKLRGYRDLNYQNETGIPDIQLASVEQSGLVIVTAFTFSHTPELVQVPIVNTSQVTRTSTTHPYEQYGQPAADWLIRFSILLGAFAVIELIRNPKDKKDTTEREQGAH